MKADSIITKLYIDTLLDIKLDRNIKDDLDMNGFAITNIKDTHDTVNKLYLQICIQRDEINMIKLLTIGIAISDLFNKYEFEVSLNKYREQFSTSMKYCEILESKFVKLDIKGNASDVVESSRFYSDLKVLTVRIIEDLPEHIFIELKISGIAKIFIKILYLIYYEFSGIL